MGGQNHQPCGAYLVNSTKLSRSVSQARIHLEQANVELENLLLQEISVQCISDSCSLEALLQYLSMSQQKTEEAIEYVCALRQQMQNLLYEDLPALHQLSLSDIGANLYVRGVVSQHSWEKMSQMMLSGSFYAVLNHFEKQLQILCGLTHDLVNALPRDSQKQISAIVEQNQEGNFKVEFAMLYQQWHAFQQDFLASSMLSTELWYAHNQSGSLLQRAVAVA